MLSDGVRRFVLVLGAIGIFGLYVFANQVMSRLVPEAPTLGTTLDRAIPFWPPAIFVYVFVYLFAFLPVVQVRDMRVFERIAHAFYAINLLALVIWIVYPVRYERPVSFDTTTLTGWGIAFNYAFDPPFNCFPSMHVANAMLFGFVARRLDPVIGDVALGLGGLISISTLLTKQHWIADVAVGTLFGWAGYRWMVLPAIRRDVPPEDLIYPRRGLWVLVGIYAAMVAAFIVAWALGARPF